MAKAKAPKAEASKSIGEKIVEVVNDVIDGIAHPSQPEVAEAKPVPKVSDESEDSMADHPKFDKFK